MSATKINRIYDKILESIIQETDLELSLENIPTKKILNTFKENLDDSRKNRSNQSRKNSQKFNANYYFEKAFFEILILQHESLWIIFTRAFYWEDYEFEVKGMEKRKLLTFLYILTNQINNLNSVLNLTKNGYYQNADKIFRNYMELSEKSLAILFEDNYFEDFQKNPSSKKEEMNHWHKQKPSKTFRIVKKVLSTLNNNDFYNLFYEVRENLYKNKSKIVHSDFKSVIEGSIFLDDNSQFVKLCLYGNIDKELKHNLNGYLVYMKIMIQSQTVILVRDYKLHFEKFGDDGRYYVFLNALTDKLFKVYLKVFLLKSDKEITGVTGKSYS